MVIRTAAAAWLYPSPELIHQARKDLKSLRATLRLARASMPDESFKRENVFFRDAGRSLSSARDRQVILEAIERIQDKPRKTAPATRQGPVRNVVEHLRRRLQREATTNAINADISRRASLAGNMAHVTSTLTTSLQNFRMP